MNKRDETLAQRSIVTCAGLLTQSSVPYSLIVRDATGTDIDLPISPFQARSHGM